VIGLNKNEEMFTEYQYGFHDRDVSIFKTEKGLTKEIVETISKRKQEPQWMLEFRLNALKEFYRMPMPTWGGDLSEIDFEDLTYYVKPSEKTERSWDEVPEEIKNTFEKLGIPEAEQKYLAGVSAQYESEVVYHNMHKQFEEQGIIFEDTDTALKNHEEIFKQYFSNEASLSLSYSFRRAHTDSNLLYYGGRVGPGGIGNVADLSVYANKREENIHNIDAYVNIPYEFFEQDHEFVFGVMYNLYKKGSDNVSSYWNNRNTPAGLAYAARTRINFNDLHIEDPRLPYVDQNNADRTIQKAIYAANKLSITEDLKLLLGTRMSYYKYKITGGADNRILPAKLLHMQGSPMI